MDSGLSHLSVDEQAIRQIAEDRHYSRILVTFTGAIHKTLRGLGHKAENVPDPITRDLLVRCTRIFRLLRGQKRWGIARSLAHIQPYLDADVRGIDWQRELNDERVCWIPDDGN